MRMFTVLAPRKPPLISARGKPRSGGRVQPTAQAVGKQRPVGQAPKGRKKRPSKTNCGLWRTSIIPIPSGIVTQFSYAPPGLLRSFWSPPTACAVGCILSLLRSLGICHIRSLGVGAVEAPIPDLESQFGICDIGHRFRLHFDQRI